MNAIIPQNFGQLSTKFGTRPMEDDLSAGVQMGFGIIGYKGKVWSIRHRGEETQLMRPDGDGPRGSVELVILKASNHISKIWYEHGYVDGSTAPPDCFSSNGVTPDASSSKKQSNACATCPMNAWGSRISPAGKQGKSCSDSKRLAVVPMNDIKNETLGGAMLLRVPAASLRDLAGYGQAMHSKGYPYYAIGTRVAFDSAEAYPKFMFSAIRPLSDAEADAVLEMQSSPGVANVLAESMGDAAPVAAEQVIEKPLFEQPPEEAPKAVTKPVKTPEPKAVPEPAKPAANVGAFGGGEAKPATKKAPAKAPAKAAESVAAAAPATAPEDVSDEDTEGSGTAFEDTLDAKLNALLGAD